MRTAALFASVLLGACASSPTQPRVNNLREYLDQSAVKCHLPTSIFKLSNEVEVRFQPPADAKYANVDCALAELKKSPFPMNLGFIGNEAVVEENKN